MTIKIIIAVIVVLSFGAFLVGQYQKALKDTQKK